MPDKLNKRPERRPHLYAFEVYRDLGYGRSFRKTAAIIGSSAQSVCRWAKSYDWDSRLAAYNVIVAQKKKEGALMVQDDDPITKKIVAIMEQMEALINSAFTKDVDGTLSPLIKVRNAEELTKLLAEHRKFLETYHRFIADRQPAKKEKDRGTHIKEFNIHMDGMSQEDRIAIMKGMTSGDEPRGDKQPAGGVQEADYTEVPGRGDEDGSGCNGVSGGTASGSSGDEEAL